MDRRQKPSTAPQAQAAASFLNKIAADMPFPVKAIQVDGGSEFMAVPGLDPGIEAACQARGIALYVLPPRSPQMNGAVERCNGAWRSEFYETYDLPDSVNEPRSSKVTSTSTITIGPMARLPEKPQPSISRTAQPRDLSRLICAEPGHGLTAAPAGPRYPA